MFSLTDQNKLLTLCTLQSNTVTFYTFDGIISSHLSRRGSVLGDLLATPGATGTGPSRTPASLQSRLWHRPAALSELAEPSYVGTALTLQTAVGFLLTTVSIQLVPVVADAAGWRWAFAPLAVGPAVGTLAMLRLRGLPEAENPAGGRG